MFVLFFLLLLLTQTTDELLASDHTGLTLWDGFVPSLQKNPLVFHTDDDDDVGNSDRRSCKTPS